MFYDWRRVGEREWERSIKGSSGSPKMALEYFSFERAPPLNTLTNSSFNVWFKNARERERGFFPRDIIFSNIIYFWDQRLIPGIIKVNFTKGVWPGPSNGRNVKCCETFSSALPIVASCSLCSSHVLLLREGSFIWHFGVSFTGVAHTNDPTKGTMKAIT